MLSIKHGEKLVKLARSTVEKVFKNGRFLLEEVDEKELKQKRGVFVTIDTFPQKNLRGCIGFPYPSLPIYEAVQRAAFSSAFEDLRFPPLKKEELDNVVFEVSILTKPKLIKVENHIDYFEKIERGKDGLILVKDSFSGLFLPQVWELLPSHEIFLKSLCLKAGLKEDCWMEKDTKIFKFRIQAFIEENPNGRIVELKL